MVSGTREWNTALHARLRSITEQPPTFLPGVLFFKTKAIAKLPYRRAPGLKPIAPDT
jgi:hypothetical protein